MSIEATSATSDRIYGHVEWFERPVTINAHTPYDKDTELQTQFTQADFQKNLSARVRISGNEIRDVLPLELDDNLTTDFGLVKMKNFPPENIVAGFQSSNLLDGKGVVYNALQNGYSPDRAIVYGSAYKAYSTAINPNKNFVGTIVDVGYKL